MELIYNINAALPTIWTIFGIVVLVRYGRQLYKELLFDPLAGGNGKVQMDELAKGIILGVFIACVYVDATRDTEYHIFSDQFYYGLLLSVWAIAAIKPFQNIKHLKKDGNPQSNVS